MSLKDIFESNMSTIQEAIRSQLGSCRIKHDAWCDGCQEQIEDVRYRCRDCIDYDMCHRCNKDAARTHPRHTLEPIYSPQSLSDHLIKPSVYLYENFGAVAYRFHGTIMDSIMQDYANDPDSETAFNKSYSYGIMFPWIPRMSVDPPYWVGNLDCNIQPATSQVPHIRCMGLRLKSSDPVDAPPHYRPPGYRFTGQPVLDAIGKAQNKLDDIYGPNALVCPLPELAERAALAYALYLSTAVEDSEGNVQAMCATLPLGINLPRGIDKEGRLDKNVVPIGEWALKMPFGEYENYIDALPRFDFYSRNQNNEGRR